MSESSLPPDIEQSREWLIQAEQEFSKAFVGSSAIFRTLAISILARGHVLIEGVPGVAKTTAARAFAAVLGSEMRRIQFTPDLLPSDITGGYVLNPQAGTFQLRKGPLFSQVVLADELNRAPSKTQSALLEAMQEGHVTVEGESLPLAQPFIVIATQNPTDLEGTYPLPEAQLDRFLLKLRLNYPAEQDELTMLQQHGRHSPTAKAVLNPEKIQRLQEAADSIFIDESMLDYIIRLVRSTRAHHQVLIGASPRAALALLRAARALALYEGADHVSPEQIRTLAEPTLAHRLVLQPEHGDDESLGRKIIAEMLSKTPFERAAFRPLAPGNR